MTIRLVILFFCVVFASLHGDDELLQVRFLQALTDTVPGQTRSIQVMVTNQSCRDQILVGHLNLPDGWEAIPANNILTHLSRGQRSIQTLMFNIPSDQAEGTYRIEYEVTGRNNVNRQGWDRTFVIVRNPNPPNICEVEEEEGADDKGSIVWEEESVLSTDNDRIEEMPHDEGISMVVTSPLTVEAAQGEIVYISALFKNSTDSERRGRVELALPANWQVVLAGDSEIVVPAQGSIVRIFGVKVSKQALAGEHKIAFTMDGVSSCQRSIRVLVLPKTDFFVQIEDPDSVYALNDRVDCRIFCNNRGNVPLRVRVEAKVDPDCELSYSTLPFEILPDDTETIVFHLSPSMNRLDECKQFILFKIINIDTGEPLYQNTICMKILPYGREKIGDEYVRIPAHVSMIALGDNGTHVFALEVAGGGLIDSTRDRYFEFFFRLPTDSRNVIYNFEQVLFMGMSEPDWELKLGDSDYNLTPLTQRYRYGRGGGIDLKRGQWWTGAHYTQNTFDNDYNPHEACAYIECDPTDRFSVSANYMHKTLHHMPKSNIVTLEAELEFPTKVHTELEVGNDFVSNPLYLDHHAYRIETRGQCLKDVWFDVEKVYAGPSFYGYYNNLSQFSSSLDFPLGSSIRANVSTNRYRMIYTSPINELDHCIVAPNQRQYNANIAYNFSDGSAFILNGLLLRSFDASDHYLYNFDQKWGGFTYFKAYNGFIFNTIVSFGQQKDYLTGMTTHSLQQYYLFLSKNISRNVIGSIFYDGGNLNYYDARPWRNSYGGSLSYQYSPRGNIDLFLQRVKHVKDAYEMSQVSVNVNHTFQNQHFLRLSGQMFYYRNHYHNDAFFLVSYTIPFDLPFGKRKDIGSVEGYIHDQSENYPVNQAMIGCNGVQMATDPSGYFAFSGLPVGRHSLKTEILPNNLITKDNQPLVANVLGGKKTRVSIPVVAACSIKGGIVQYAFDDFFRQMQLPEDQRNKLIVKGGLEGIRVTISLDNGSEIYTCLTNNKGGFSFNKLRPGSWTIEINTNHLPALHHLNMNNLSFEVEPGEDKNITFNVLPQEPKVYKLD